MRILGPRTVDLMQRNHLPGNKDLTKLGIGGFSETANEGIGFGLGFAMTVDADKTGSISHSDYYWRRRSLDHLLDRSGPRS